LSTVPSFLLSYVGLFARLFARSFAQQASYTDVPRQLKLLDLILSRQKIILS